MGWSGMWHVWQRAEVHPGFWWGNLREGERESRLKHLGVDRRIILKYILK